MSPLGVALLVAGVQLLATAASGLPSSGPPTSTASPTNLASPLQRRRSFDGVLRVTVLDVASSPRPVTRLSMVRPGRHEAWPRPRAPAPTAATLTTLSTRRRGLRRYRTPEDRLATSTLPTPTATLTTLSSRRRGLRRYRTAEDPLATSTLPTPTTVTSPTTIGVPTTASSPTSSRPSTSLIGVGTTPSAERQGTRLSLQDDRNGRAAWTGPSANAATSDEAANEHFRKYYSTGGGATAPAALSSNTSWWSASQAGTPTGNYGAAAVNYVAPAVGTYGVLRRAAHHRKHHHGQRPFVAAHWDDPDYGDSASGGSQVVPYAHAHHQHATPVYVVDQKKEDSNSDLTTKLIILAVIKLLIVKALGLGAFKLIALGLIKIPIVLGAFALKFAVVIKFFKFIKTAETVFLAVLVIPILVIAVVPLLLPILIPIGLLLIPLFLIPLLLLFPVPVLTPGGGAAGGGTVITITPGRRRREEEEAQLAQLESRVADSRRCLQKMACDVGYRSQAVKGYADFVMWLLGLLKPIMGETRRAQLKGYMAAYKSGLSGRSCYRKYPCFANNLNVERATASAATKESSRADAGPADNSTIPSTETEVVDSSASVEERIVYDLANASATGSANATGIE